MLKNFCNFVMLLGKFPLSNKAKYWASILSSGHTKFVVLRNTLPWNRYTYLTTTGQWLCGSVGRFQYHKSAVSIQSSAKNYLYWTFVYCQLWIEKTKINKKRSGMAHFLLQLLPSTYNLLHTTFYLLPSTCYLLPSTYYLLPTTFYLLPTTHYLLPSTYYLLPTTFYLLPTTL